MPAKISLEEDREVCKIGPRPILKALSWLSRTAEVPALQPILQASLIRAFLTQPTTDRKEALPLPMAVVVAWERYICSPPLPTRPAPLLGRPLASSTWGPKVRRPTTHPPQQPITHQHQPTWCLLADEDHQKGTAICSHTARHLRQSTGILVGSAILEGPTVSLDSHRNSLEPHGKPRFHPSSAHQPGWPGPPKFHLLTAYGI